MLLETAGLRSEVALRSGRTGWGIRHKETEPLVMLGVRIKLETKLH